MQLDKYPDPMTTAHVAEILDCTERHVERLIKGGALAAKNIGLGKKRIWRILKQELERFLAEGPHCYAPTRAEASRQRGKLRKYVPQICRPLATGSRT